MSEESPGPERDEKDTEAETSAEEIVEDAAERNPDPVTRREAAERELLDADRSDDGETVGDHIE